MSDDHRILFVGGLHRSGTTPVTRWISQHPEISAFRDTGVAEDEGQHLQSVYRTASSHGGPGRFAFDPNAHLTEASDLVSQENRRSIWSDWSPHWNLAMPVLVEKSPPNVIRARFLQALFGGQARFLAVIRHPLAVTYATKRWTGVLPRLPPRLTRRVELLQAGAHRLLCHWIAAHEILLADAAHLENLLVVRYEDLVLDPASQLATIFSFLNLEPYEGRWEVKPALNQRYIDRWERHQSHPIGRLYMRRAIRELEDQVLPFGYSLEEPREISAPGRAVARYMASEAIRPRGEAAARPSRG